MTAQGCFAFSSTRRSRSNRSHYILRRKAAQENVHRLPSLLTRNMMADLDTVEIIARCLCRANNLSWHLTTSCLPLDAEICICDSCRHGTGTLGFTACTWPLPIPELPCCSKAALSPRADVYFCMTCGTVMFLHVRSLPWIVLALGTLEDLTICKLSMYLCLADTQDGSMSVWLQSVTGTRLEKYATHDLRSEFETTSAIETTSAKEGGEVNLKASCRCGELNLR